jgi:hypothetical protein
LLASKTSCPVVAPLPFISVHAFHKAHHPLILFVCGKHSLPEIAIPSPLVGKVYDLAPRMVFTNKPLLYKINKIQSSLLSDGERDRYIRSL